MADQPREAWITGIGIVSSLGEGPEAHWQRLMGGKPTADTTTFPPFVLHPLPRIDFDKQIPKKSDQRQMEPWQRIGTYAAGLALEDAGLKGHSELLARVDMIVAASGGERDVAADSGIMTGWAQADAPDRFLNERLMSDLRPTLFLAQLSNLLAGNISIVHGVTGSSRTFMGEEMAGVDAVRIALARLKSGQSEMMLVGGAYNCERKEMIMLYEFGGLNLKGDFHPVWERAPGGGFAQGSIGAFLVLEEMNHAKARAATPFARLSEVAAEASHRRPGSVENALQRLWDRVAEHAAVDASRAAVISGATGAEPATSEERAFLARHRDLAVRATGTHIGHGFEPQFAMNIALAALAIKHGALFPPVDGSGIEQPMQQSLLQAVVTGVGHWRGEGLALVEAAL